MSTAQLVLRRGGLSTRVPLRGLLVLAALVAATAVVFVLEVARGELAVPVGDVLAALVGGGDDATAFIVRDLRLPRALAAVLSGAALGVAGMLLQDLVRNPLAAPELVGISTGAALSAISFIVFADADGALTVPLAALGGALGAGVLLVAMAGRGQAHGFRLVLIGIGLTAVLHAGINYVLTRGRLVDVQQAYVWLVGSLNGRGWEHVTPLAVTLGVLLLISPWVVRWLTVLQLGDDLARALGEHVTRARYALLAVVVTLTGIAVAAVGPVAFVAFGAPHLARRLVASAAPGIVLPAAAVCGALIVVTSDLIGRELAAPTEIPVGLITAILAAPFFLHLLFRAGRRGTTA